MAITQGDVVRTALRLLDDVGLEGLTRRRLGGELGVSAATLYWHVRDKVAPDPDSTFRPGLALILAGLRARHAELAGAIA